VGPRGLSSGMERTIIEVNATVYVKGDGWAVQGFSSLVAGERQAVHMVSEFASFEKKKKKNVTSFQPRDVKEKPAYDFTRAAGTWAH